MEPESVRPVRDLVLARTAGEEKGGADGNFFRPAGVPSYGASDVDIDPNDVCAHGKDERTPTGLGRAPAPG